LPLYALLNKAPASQPKKLHLSKSNFAKYLKH